MPKIIDDFLNATTMFRLMVYYLGGLLAIAVIFSFGHVLPYDGIDLIACSAFLIALCYFVNLIFALLWRVPTNAESALVTGLILSLIITPGKPDTIYTFLIWAAALAIASKFILNVRGKHVFNPAAFGVAATSLFLSQSATWWIGGNLTMLPFVAAGGILIVRKIRRSDMVWAYVIFAIISSLPSATLSLDALYTTMQLTIVHTSLIFFAFVMITEPVTTPPRRLGRILYGALVGILSGPWVHLGPLYYTPELALVTGNVFSYIVSPKFRAVLYLKDIRKVAKDTYEFIFTGKLPHFKPGQYAEWTIKAAKSDARGNRRYFTIASSPTEQEVKLGIKFYPKPSTFKVLLSVFKDGSPVLSGSIAGDFTMPRNKNAKLAFIAGGIGVTPFRSMVKYMLDMQEKRDVVLMYSNKSDAEIAYRDIFNEAEKAGIGFRAVYTLTDKGVRADWTGERGFINAEMIKKHMPDYKERIFYISGPRSMVDAFKRTLKGMGVSRWKIHTDYFPGFA